jgi:hypothetical protein
MQEVLQIILVLDIVRVPAVVPVAELANDQGNPFANAGY